MTFYSATNQLTITFSFTDRGIQKQKLTHRYQLDPIISPVNLLKPDGYEFYSVDQRGEIIKRMMTKNEVKSIAAGNSLQDSVLMSFGEQQSVIKDIVITIKDVLNTELKIITDGGNEILKPLEHNMNHPALLNDGANLQQYGHFNNIPSETKPSIIKKNITKLSNNEKYNFPELNSNTQFTDIKNESTGKDKGFSKPYQSNKVPSLIDQFVTLAHIDENITDLVPITEQSIDYIFTDRNDEKSTAIKSSASMTNLNRENSIHDLNTPSFTYHNTNDSVSSEEKTMENILTTTLPTDHITANSFEKMFDDVLELKVNYKHSLHAAYLSSLESIQQSTLKYFSTTIHPKDSFSDNFSDKSKNIYQSVVSTYEESAISYRPTFENNTNSILKSGVDTHNQYSTTEHSEQTANYKDLPSKDNFNKHTTDSSTSVEESSGADNQITLHSFDNANPPLLVFDEQNSKLEHVESLSSNDSFNSNTFQSISTLTEANHTKKINNSIESYFPNITTSTDHKKTDMKYNFNSLVTEKIIHKRITDSILEHGKTSAASDQKFALPNLENVIKLLMLPMLNMDRYASETATAASRIQYTHTNIES